MNLEWLNLLDCKNVSDLMPLASLTDLWNLDIKNTSVTSLDGLENMVELSILNAKGCNLTDTSALDISGCKKALEQ